VAEERAAAGGVEAVLPVELVEGKAVKNRIADKLPPDPQADPPAGRLPRKPR
jgi:hypothetical protein